MDIASLAGNIEHIKRKIVKMLNATMFYSNRLIGLPAKYLIVVI